VNGVPLGQGTSLGCSMHTPVANGALGLGSHTARGQPAAVDTWPLQPSPIRANVGALTVAVPPLAAQATPFDGPHVQGAHVAGAADSPALPGVTVTMKGAAQDGTPIGAPS